MREEVYDKTARHQQFRDWKVEAVKYMSRSGEMNTLNDII